MRKTLFAMFLAAACYGCGASVDEVGPIEEPGESIPEEEYQDYMQESMQRGGYQEGQRPQSGGPGEGG